MLDTEQMRTECQFGVPQLYLIYAMVFHMDQYLVQLHLLFNDMVRFLR